MSRLLTSILMSLLLPPSLITAQAQSSLVKGQQVRVVSRCSMAGDSVPRCLAPSIPWPYERTYSGQLEALEADTLHIRVRSNEAAFAIPTASIVRVSIVDGTRGHFWVGAGIGLLGGALMGGAIGSTQDLSGSFFFSETNPTVLGVVLGAPAGFLLGGVIGALIRSDRWRAVPIQDYRIGVAPGLDAVGLTVALTF